MKQITKFFASAIAMIAISASTFAQGVSATASATATIITPISITKTADMNFGNIAVNATAGTVVLTPAGLRSVTGGCTLPTVGGTIGAAAFTVSGLATSTYSISITPVSITISGSGPDMTVDTWTSTPSGTGTIDGTALTVGATLHVAGSQTAGTYTSATPFTVTVDYN